MGQPQTHIQRKLARRVARRVGRKALPTRMWPRFQKHNEVRCYKCTGLCRPETLEVTGYMGGRYRQYCPDCEVWTFYDLEGSK